MAITGLILGAMLHMLLKSPLPNERQDLAPPMRLALLPRSFPVERSGVPPAAARRPVEPVDPPAGRRGAADPVPSPVPAAGSRAESLAGRLYTREGRVRMVGNEVPPQSGAPGRPPGSRDETEARPAQRLMSRPDPVDYRQTRFDKDWASDGNLMQLADQALGDAMKKLRPGSGASPAAARPPPEVRFNPALHEHPADLGSVATGDAYKAAPIAFEKAPDLKGGASARIRRSLEETESRYARCGGERIRTQLAPVLVHLRALERVEYAMANGADPIRMANLLPREADSAYDLARRAVWYAQSKLESCG